MAGKSENDEFPSKLQNEDVTIRHVESEDKARWLDLFHQYILFYESSLSDEQYETTWNRLFESNVPIFCLVAIYNEQVVGIAHYLFHPSTWSLTDSCYLQDLFVDPTIRGVGIGRKLINAVLEIAKTHGSSRLYWNTQESNTQARRLYDTFTPVSDFRQYRITIPTQPIPPPPPDQSSSIIK